MNSEDLNNTINTLERAISGGMFDMSQNDKKLKKILHSIGKIQNKSYQNSNSSNNSQSNKSDHKLCSSDYHDGGFSEIPTNVVQNLAVKSPDKHNTSNTKRNKHLSSSEPVSSASTASSTSMSESVSESTTASSYSSIATTHSELIPMTCNQPPSDMFACSESEHNDNTHNNSDTFYHHNLALNLTLTEECNEDSDRIIVLK